MKIIYESYIWIGSFDANDLMSVNEVLGNFQMAVYQYNNPYVSGFVNLQPIRILIFILLNCLIIIK